MEIDREEAGDRCGGYTDDGNPHRGADRPEPASLASNDYDPMFRPVNLFISLLLGSCIFAMRRALIYTCG